MPTNGTSSSSLTEETSSSDNATPPISATNVSRVTAIEPMRLTSPMRGPSRSRTRSNVARPLTAATRPDISAKTQMPSTPTMHDPRQRQTEASSDLGVGDQVADVDEPADRGEDAERDCEDLLHVVGRNRSATTRSLARTWLRSAIARRACSESPLRLRCARRRWRLWRRRAGRSVRRSSVAPTPVAAVLRLSRTLCRLLPRNR